MKTRLRIIGIVAMVAIVGVVNGQVFERRATVTGGGAGTGNGTVTFDVAGSPGGDRTGTISVGGQTFTVTQHGDDGH